MISRLSLFIYCFDAPVYGAPVIIGGLIFPNKGEGDLSPNLILILFFFDSAFAANKISSILLFSFKNPRLEPSNLVLLA